jgi:hypothetical protein
MRTRLPVHAEEIFPEAVATLSHLEENKGQMELLIGLDNTKWLPEHVEYARDPDDDLQPVKSAFDLVT